MLPTFTIPCVTTVLTNMVTNSNYLIMPEAVIAEPTAWTPERVSRALRLYLLEDQTASAVAEALGGVTRAAVIAKVRRLGYFKQETGAARPSGPAPAETRRSRPPNARVEVDRRCFPPHRRPVPLPPLREVAATGTPTTLARLPRAACRWPIDDPGPGRMHLALFCAGPTIDGRYCAAHRAIGFGRVEIIASPPPSVR